MWPHELSAWLVAALNLHDPMNHALAVIAGLVIWYAAVIGIPALIGALIYGRIRSLRVSER
ncbi:MAG TPA: hypothetical protein VFM75_02015 [Modicisalibacter sp.]|nr:hypothetical protein [Modicisalibacter sp.]